MYLKDRRAVAMNHNPFMAFNDDPRPEYMDQVHIMTSHKTVVLEVII